MLQAEGRNNSMVWIGFTHIYKWNLWYPRANPIFLLCSTGSLSEPVYILELAVLALARIMCADIHGQNGIPILAQDLIHSHSETLSASPLLCV